MINAVKNRPAVRAEERSIMLFLRDIGRTAVVSGAELEVLKNWAVYGKETSFTNRLYKLGLLCDEIKEELIYEIDKSNNIKSPLRSLCAPESIHIELTEECPLNCPQCYKKNIPEDNVKADLDNMRLHEILLQAANIKIFQIAFGGGEPMMYTSLIDIISAVSSLGMASSVTSSGINITSGKLRALKKAGLNHIQISLNGSTEEINSKSRDGYRYALKALELLSAASFSFGVNWVARKDNIKDFADLYALAVRTGANNVNILRYKPSSQEDYHKNSPEGKDMILLESAVKATVRRASVTTSVTTSIKTAVKMDSAFSSMLCHMHGRAGGITGCGAGRRFMALDAKGFFRPCSHVSLKKHEKSIMDYWYGSEDLHMFRSLEDNIGEPCRDCAYLKGCRGCRAVCEEFTDGEKGCVFGRASGNV